MYKYIFNINRNKGGIKIKTEQKILADINIHDSIQKIIKFSDDTNAN